MSRCSERWRSFRRARAEAAAGQRERQVCRRLERRDLFLVVQAPLFGIAHDAPGIPARLRFDAAMRVPRAVTPDGEIGFQTIGAGHFGITTQTDLCIPMTAR